MRRRLPALLPVLLLAGCGAPQGVTGAATDAAQRMLAAAAAGDGAAACALLAPDTVSELEDSAGTPCEQAIGDAGLPAPGPVRSADVYGQRAIVVTDADTLFLGAFEGGWRVVAAGCSPRGDDRPYDCELTGG